MAGQLEGVLCEVAVASLSRTVETRTAPRTSTMFTPQSRGSNDHPDVRRLPTPIVDPEDQHAGIIVTLSVASPNDIVKHVAGISERSVELELWLVRALIALDRFDEAVAILDAMARAPISASGAPIGIEVSSKWRVETAGMLADTSSASIDTFPASWRPSFALAMATELAGDHAAAAQWYEIVTGTDEAFTSAAFGLARCRRELGDPRGRDPRLSTCARKLELVRSSTRPRG